VLVVGWLASWMFPAETNLMKEWTFWGWREKRKMLGLEPVMVPGAMEAKP
jgi:hypothetical protein